MSARSLAPFPSSLSLSQSHVRTGAIKIIIFLIRVGRTARAGRKGVSVSLVGEQERFLMKAIIKNTTNSIKRRLIAPDIIEKYNKKLQSLEPDMEQILEEERNEKELSTLENQVNVMEKLLEDENNEDERTCFQTEKERKKQTSIVKVIFLKIFVIIAIIFKIN